MKMDLPLEILECISWNILQREVWECFRKSCKRIFRRLEHHTRFDSFFEDQNRKKIFYKVNGTLHGLCLDYCHPQCDCLEPMGFSCDHTGILLKKGYYNNGIKTGDWIESKYQKLRGNTIHYIVRITQYHGKYYQGKRDGIWITKPVPMRWDLYLTYNDNPYDGVVYLPPTPTKREYLMGSIVSCIKLDRTLLDEHFKNICRVKLWFPEETSLAPSTEVKLRSLTSLARPVIPVEVKL